jgi:hypothetical protein
VPYSKAASKTMKSFQRRYGARWKRVYYGLANKRSGRGLKGKSRGHVAANRAFAKGSHWKGSGRKGRKRSGGRRRRSKSSNVKVL